MNLATNGSRAVAVVAVSARREADLDEKMWELFGTGRHEQLCELYWELMRIKDEEL